MAKRRKKQVDEPDLVKRDGAIVLTFVNTGSRRGGRLLNYADLLNWVDQRGALEAAEVKGLRELANEQVDAAAEAFAIAEELRDVLTRIFNAAVDRHVAPAHAVDRLNALLTMATPRRMLVPRRGIVGLARDWPKDSERDLFRPLWAVVAAAVDLLTSDEDCSRVKRCVAEDCDVLFLPRKVAGMQRKWCSIRSCSAPARSRQYYQQVTKPQRKAFKEREAMRNRRI